MLVFVFPFVAGEFFANNSAGLMSLGCDRESGEQVRGEQDRLRTCCAGPLYVVRNGHLGPAKHRNDDRGSETHEYLPTFAVGGKSVCYLGGVCQHKHRPAQSRHKCIEYAFVLESKIASEPGLYSVEVLRCL